MSMQEEMIQKELFEARMEAELTDTAKRLYQKELRDLTEKEALSIADEVRREAADFDLYKLDSKAFANMLMAACNS